MLSRSPVLPDGRPYGCLEFGGDIHENALCKAVIELLDWLIPSGTCVNRIIEIGSGGGRWSRHLSKLTADLVCIDATDKTVDHVEALNLASQPTYLICKDGNLPSRPGQLLHNSAEFVFSFDTFVHFPATLCLRYLHRVADALRPGGVFILHHGSEIDKQPRQPIDKSGCWHYYQDDLLDQMLREQGLLSLPKNSIRATEGFGSRVAVYVKEPKS